MHFEESSYYCQYNFCWSNFEMYALYFCTSCGERHYLTGYDKMVFVTSDGLGYVSSLVTTLTEGRHENPQTSYTVL